MAQSDSIAIVFDEAELKKIQDAVDVLNALLLPKLKILSAQDRRELPKMGDKSVGFVQKSFDYGQIHEALRPPYLDLAAFAIDLNALKILQLIDRKLTPLMEALHDSQALAGSEAYQAALLFYNSVKNAVKLKIPGAQSVYDDLAARFPGTWAAAKAATDKA